MHIDRFIKIATGRKHPPRYTFDVHFTSEEEKEAFTRLKSIRELLMPKRKSFYPQLWPFQCAVSCRSRSLLTTSASGPSEKLMVKIIHELHATRVQALSMYCCAHVHNGIRALAGKTKALIFEKI